MLLCPLMPFKRRSLFFFFNDTATTEIYTLSLHDALPIFDDVVARERGVVLHEGDGARAAPAERARSEEHTSELQSPDHLVCRLLLEKKKKHRALTTRAYLPITVRHRPG